MTLVVVTRRVDAEVAIVGAGAVGASTAYHLAQEGVDVLVLEKETGPALHQSGRNSGVVHAGYQYEPGSLKARFATEGAQRLIAYCRERGIPVNQDGLLVAAQTDEQADRLDTIQARAEANNVETRWLGAEEIERVEPNAHGIAGLHVPAYASFDARTYVHTLTGDAIRAGASFLYDTTVTGFEESEAGARLETSKGRIEAEAVVNAAGLHADRLAGALCKDMRVIPFRGYYAELVPPRRGLVRSHVYPVPDPALPFLGVHFSKRTDGRVIVGPGAMLALGREAYTFWGANLHDVASTFSWPGLYRLLMRSKIRSLVSREVKKSLSLRALAAEARNLVPGIEASDLVRSYAGNRAQMVDRSGELVMDLVVREGVCSVHVLNAISPGLTCSLPFGEHLATRAMDAL